MWCSLNLYQKYIYAEYFMTYLLSAFKRLECPHRFLRHGGGGANRMRLLAPPPPCWGLILRDTQAQQYGGGGGWGRSRIDLSEQTFSSPVLMGVIGSAAPPLIYWSLASALLSLFAEANYQPPPVAAHLWVRESFLSHIDRLVADFFSIPSY